MSNANQTTPNMVQGVSQQAAQERRNSQCESQFDCLNQAVQGCVARPGLQWVKLLTATDLTDGFWYNVMRSATERYVISIKGGAMAAWNFADPTAPACTITALESVSGYLTAMGGGLKDWNQWSATAASDTIFFLNKQIKPAMTGTVSASRDPEALFWFRSGSYKATYKIRIKLSGTWYEWSYTTPDNSDPDNAKYITTDALCEALYDAMVMDTSHAIGHSGTGHLNFDIERSGNIIRLSRTGGTDFDIETSDALNNTQLSGIKGEVGSVQDLPANGFDGMIFKVTGDVTADADDYYLQFDSRASSGDSTTQGAWVEVVAPTTPTTIDRTKMPIVVKNTALNTFSRGYGTWGLRLAGDTDSAKDPSFIGQQVQDIFYDQARLAFLTEFSSVWSRVKNPFVFFPDTVQVSLFTAPIDAEFQQAKGVAVLKRPVQFSGATFVWAEDQQFAVTHGDNSIFSNSTIEVNGSTAYAWNDDIAPQALGNAIIFATSDSKWSTLTEVPFQQGVPIGDTGISDHVPNYIPADLRMVVGSDTAKKIFCYADSTPNMLYVYEYRKTQAERLQSAWNIWRLPPDSHILHVVLDKTALYVFVKRADGVHLFTCVVAPNQQDAEGRYLTRLDFRVTDEQCTVSYNLGADETSFVLPYKAGDAMDHLLGAGPMSVVVRSNTGDDIKRGQVLNIKSLATVGSVTTIKVSGDWSAVPVYIGFVIRSERTESTFYRRDDQTGYVYTYRLQVMSHVLAVKDTSYTRAEVVMRDGFIKRDDRHGGVSEGHYIGDPGNLLDEVPLFNGDMPMAVGEKNTDHHVRYINDTPFASAWQGYTVVYTPTIQ